MGCKLELVIDERYYLEYKVFLIFMSVNWQFYRMLLDYDIYFYEIVN